MLSSLNVHDFLFKAYLKYHKIATKEEIDLFFFLFSRKILLKYCISGKRKQLYFKMLLNTVK